MLNFKLIEKSDINKFQKYYDNPEGISLTTNILSAYLWRNEYNIKFALYNNCLIKAYFNDDDSVWGYCLPHGEDIKPAVEEIIKDAHRIVIIDNVVDTTNIGAIFRSAAALGIDGALLTRNSCDPLNRRAVRVSMGSVFLIPWTWIDNIDEIKKEGFKTVAMALTDNSISLDSPILQTEEKLAIIMGAEGDGLPHDTIHNADYTVRIPMGHGVDSLNVAAASAVAFWQLRKK